MLPVAVTPPDASEFAPSPSGFSGASVSAAAAAAAAW